MSVDSAELARFTNLADVRRSVIDGGPLGFGQVVTPHLLSSEPSPLHLDLNAWHLRERQRPPGARDAYAAPRGHGKSTGGIEVPALWHAATCTRRYIVIASDTWSQAVRRLETITTEIENNADLRALFPRLRPARDRQANLVAWRDDELALACGCRIIAVGAGKSIRGAKAGEQRPDLALVDDLEDEASVATKEALAKRLRWLLRTVLPLGGVDKGLSVLWVGTILSRQALLNAATGAALDEGHKRPLWARSWTPHVYRAEVKGTPTIPTVVIDPDTGEPVIGDDGKPLRYSVGEPMWKVLTRETLASIRYSVGPASYAAEYQSDPVETGTPMLAPARRAIWVNPDAPPLSRIARLPDGSIAAVASMTRAAALDPQYGDEGSQDPDLAAIVVVGQLGQRTFLLDSWIGRDRHGQAGRLVSMATLWGCYAAAVEAVAAQVLTADSAAQLGRIPIVRVTPAKGKTERALGLQVRLGDREVPGSGRVFAMPEVESNPPYGSILDYLEAFPNGRYDDPVDTVVMAVDLAARAAPVQQVGSGPSLGGARTM